MNRIFIALAAMAAMAGYLLVRKWTPPKAAGPYLPHIRAAELAYGLPENLLARLLYQESRYRQDIISGQTVSPVGALGIAQIVPKWHPGVDPLKPTEAIPYAAKYLRSLYEKFRSRVTTEAERWSLALAAYNWGQGNLGKDFADGIIGDDWPEETKKYSAQILADVPIVERIA